LLFDEQYRIICEQGDRLAQTTDEDGFPCEDVDLLTEWVRTQFRHVIEDPKFDVEAVNFSGYGASLVHLDDHGKILTPLYNYLKPYPDSLKKTLYTKYGGVEEFCVATASPSLGSLNSGFQLYRIKKENPRVFKRIKHSLHLPQYLTHVLSGAYHSEITSVGCHTHLWDFRKNDYHDWVKEEELLEKFPPLYSSLVGGLFEGRIPVGPGYHDSSSALIPYLTGFTEPFVLISTGTWMISMNPFNSTPLTAEELDADCLCYLTPEGRQVKSSRYFGGDEHENPVETPRS
jgi:sugar (pentulose or hexulose) kinase